MELYVFLDIAGTAVEIFCMGLILTAFCKEPKRRWLKYMPLLANAIFIFFWTWIIVDGQFKLLALIIFLSISIKLCYKDSLVKIVNSSLLIYTMVVISETLTALAVYVMGFPQSQIVDGLQFASVLIYIIHFIVFLLIACAIHLLFRNYQYEITIKDFGILIVGYAIIIYEASKELGLFSDGNLNWFNLQESLLRLAVSLAFVILFLYLRNYYSLRYKERENQMIIERLELQHSHYQERLREEERVRAIYHDLKNHLLVLENQGGENAQVHKSIESLKKQIAGYENFYNTGNEFLDIIVRDKAEKAKEQRIDFSVMLNFEDGTFVEPLDISTIFGNAFDNAIEASMKLPVSERLITAKCSRVRDMLSIVIENNAAAPPTDKKSSKQDGFLHGYGSENIKKAVERYGGECSSIYENGRFSLKIIFPIP